MRLFPRSLQILSSAFTRAFLPTVSGQRFFMSTEAMSELLVGVCQMSSGSNVGTNIETCKKLIGRAKDRGAKVSGS